MEKNGAITDKTPDVRREQRPAAELEKTAQIRDAARTLKTQHKSSSK